MKVSCVDDLPTVNFPLHFLFRGNLFNDLLQYRRPPVFDTRRSEFLELLVGIGITDVDLLQDGYARIF